jgi:hypothetical protein
MGSSEKRVKCYIASFAKKAPESSIKKSTKNFLLNERPAKKLTIGLYSFSIDDYAY